MTAATPEERLVRARYPEARACRFPDVLAAGGDRVQMRGRWVIYAAARSRRRLGSGPDAEAAWRDAASRLGEGG
jgi:hypothetical protein